MREIPNELQVRLDSGATRLCRCWKIVRADGAELGFTDHDGPLSFDGVAFQAASGMDASALQTSTGLSVDNGQAVGALSAASIREEDIRAGKYDGAEVYHWLVDWERPDLRVLLFRGTLGEMRRSDGAFEVELRGQAEALNKPVGRSILRSCDRVLGDGRCRFDLDTPGFSAEVETSRDGEGARVFSEGLAGFDADWFRHGTVSWFSGANVGTRSAVKSDRVLSDGTRVLELWKAPGAAVLAGDRMRVSAGCDKSAATCRAKFSNLVNFRGFPHLPGEDWVTAYPKVGEVHDGSSLG
jgi:uncharacterized phage protein (TIGR02218 family)